MIRRVSVDLLVFATFATIVLCPLSYIAPQGVDFVGSDGEVVYNLKVLDGKLSFWRWQPAPPTTPAPRRWSARFAGFTVMVGAPMFSESQPSLVEDYLSFIFFPFWALFLLFAAYPTVLLLRGPVRRNRRRLHGLCEQCGYDVTSGGSVHCPECGKARWDE